VAVLAVAEASAEPFCVLFPLVYAHAAVRYHAEFPEIPVVVLKGLAPGSGLPAADGILCIYSTDRDTDLYRAGLFAGIIGSPEEKQAANSPEGEDPDEAEAVKDPRNVVLLQGRFVSTTGRELFSRGVREEHPESGVLFINTAAGMPDSGKISCVVLAGGESDYLEKSPVVPLVLFTWLDPLLVPDAVTAVFDDSPWALAVTAVRMALEKQAEGSIPSKPLVILGKFVDRGVFKRLKRSAEKTS
jgi:hypothetical protein